MCSLFSQLSDEGVRFLAEVIEYVLYIKCVLSIECVLL
jgi:hypothetical protein